MTIAHSYNRVINPLEEVALRLTYFVLSAVLRVVKVSSRLPFLVSWLIGMLLLITVGFLYTLIIYIPLLVARKKTKSDAKKMIKNIDKISETEAMELHLDMESFRERLDNIVDRANRFFVFAPITFELKKTSNSIKKVEEALFMKAYPEQENALTESQTRELFDLMKGWREDEKANMEVY